MLDNGVLLAGILLDPTTIDLLTDEQEARARKSVISLVARMRGVEIVSVTQPNTTELSSESIPTDSDEELQMAMKKHKASMCSDSDDEENNQQSRIFPASQRERTQEKRDSELNTSVNAAIDNIKEKRREYKKMKDQAVNEYPEILQDVTKLCFAMPPTQASVERVFSALKIFKTDLRNRLNSETLDAMLFLKSNM